MLTNICTKLWVRLQVYEREYGITSPQACKARKQWGKIHRLRMKLDSVNHMDKKENLKCLVTDAWDTLNEFEEIFGHNSTEYERARAKWSAYDTVWRIMFPDESY